MPDREPRLGMQHALLRRRGFVAAVPSAENGAMQLDLLSPFARGRCAGAGASSGRFAGPSGDSHRATQTRNDAVPQIRARRAAAELPGPWRAKRGGA